MQPEDPPVDSNDPDAVACKAGDQSISKEDREGAFAGLHGLVRRLTTNLSIRLTGRVRQDFVDGSIGEIFIRIDKYRQGDSFTGWCYRTLHNWMIDELRKESRRSEHERRYAGMYPEVVSAQPPILEPSPEQMHFISQLPLSQRLALLSLTGLWNRFPAEMWQQWCRDYTLVGPQCLPMPFPPEEFLQSTNAQERAEMMAELLQIRRVTLAVWIHRWSTRLQNIQRTSSRE